MKVRFFDEWEDENKRMKDEEGKNPVNHVKSRKSWFKTMRDKMQQRSILNVRNSEPG